MGEHRNPRDRRPLITPEGGPFHKIAWLMCLLGLLIFVIGVLDLIVVVATASFDVGIHGFTSVVSNPVWHQYLWWAIIGILIGATVTVLALGVQYVDDIVTRRKSK